MKTNILRLTGVLTRTGDKRSTHYNNVSEGLFTSQVSLGPRAVGWPEYEVDVLNAARIAGYTDDQIRELVVALHTKRKDLMASWELFPEGLWTTQASLGPRAVGRPDHEVDVLNAARIAGYTDDQINELVVALHNIRKDLAATTGTKLP